MASLLCWVDMTSDGIEIDTIDTWFVIWYLIGIGIPNHDRDPELSKVRAIVDSDSVNEGKLSAPLN